LLVVLRVCDICAVWPSFMRRDLSRPNSEHFADGEDEDLRWGGLVSGGTKRR
jgi:hypothetical protein